MPSILIRTLITYFFLTVGMKLLGKRQVGELDVSELIATMVISEIASLPIDDPDIPLSHSLTAVFIIIMLQIVITYSKNKSRFMKKIFENKQCILIRRGVLNQTALSDMRISIEELLGQLRIQGVTSIDDVNYAIVEDTGDISVILKSEKLPLTKESIGKEEKTDPGIMHALIVDGIIHYDNLRACGKSKAWLDARLSERHAKSDDVFLFTVDDADNISFILREKRK